MTPENAQRAEESLKGILDVTPDGSDKRILESVVGTLHVYNEVTATQDGIRVQIPEPATQSAEKILGGLVPEYRKHKHSPEVLTCFNRSFYEVYAKAIGLEINVPDLQAPEKEIKKPMPTVKGKRVKSLALYYPPELQGKEGLVRLGRMFNLGSWSVQENTSIVSTKIPAIWLGIEGTVDAPNTNTCEEDLTKHAQKHNLLGQDLNLYILGSRFFKFLESCHFDQGATWSRLPASRHGGLMVYASCAPGGRVLVPSSLDPDNRDPNLGARFARVLSS